MAAAEKATTLGVRVTTRDLLAIDVASTLLDVPRSVLVRELFPPSEDWARVLAYIAQSEANGEMGDALYVLAAEGLKRWMIEAGVERTTVEPLGFQGVARAYQEFRNALAAHIGTTPPFDLGSRGYRVERPPAGGELERTGRMGLYVLAEFEELTPDGVRLRSHIDDTRPPAPAPWTVERMLATLRSPNQTEREQASELLARSVAGGLRLSGASIDEAARAWDQVRPLLERAIAGDETAVEALEARLSAAPPEAAPAKPPVLVEPTARERELADRHDAGELLDMLERKGLSRNRRRELVHALCIRVGQEHGVRAAESASVGEFHALTDRIIDGDAEALEAAREWVAAHLIVREPAE